jgi:hypothetical protein
MRKTNRKNPPRDGTSASKKTLGLRKETLRDLTPSAIPIRGGASWIPQRNSKVVFGTSSTGSTIG